MVQSRLARVAAGLALALAPLASACVRQTLTPGGGVAPGNAAAAGNAGIAGIAPQLAAERFLRAANCVASQSCASKAQDVETMGRLFGTRDGSIARRDSRSDVEQRMYAVASLVRSEDYRVQAQNSVPGRVGEAVELIVVLRQQGREVQVPITMVKARGGDWLVEKIDVKPLTQNQ